VRGRAGGGQAAGRRRSAALAGMLRGGEEETEGPLSAVALPLAAAALPLRRRRCLAVAAAHPGRCRRCPGGGGSSRELSAVPWQRRLLGEGNLATAALPWRRCASWGVSALGPLAWAIPGLIFFWARSEPKKRLAYSDRRKPNGGVGTAGLAK
jgi:hypothetical protein